MDFEKLFRISHFKTIRPVGSEVFHADGQTHIKKLIVAFRRIANVSKKYRVIPSVLDPRKCEYLKDYSLFNLIFCKYILYL
jgi:hypothetical protein